MPRWRSKLPINARQGPRNPEKAVRKAKELHARSPQILSIAPVRQSASGGGRTVRSPLKFGTATNAGIAAFRLVTESRIGIFFPAKNHQPIRSARSPEPTKVQGFFEAVPCGGNPRFRCPRSGKFMPTRRARVCRRGGMEPVPDTSGRTRQTRHGRGIVLERLACSVRVCERPRPRGPACALAACLRAGCPGRAGGACAADGRDGRGLPVLRPLGHRVCADRGARAAVLRILPRGREIDRNAHKLRQLPRRQSCQGQVEIAPANRRGLPVLSHHVELDRLRL